MRDHLPGELDWWGSEFLLRRPGDALWAEGCRRVTYGELRAQVGQLRRLFRLHGIRPGATVALQGTESFTQLWSILALWATRAQVILLGPRIRGEELGRLLDHCRPQFYVTFSSSGPGQRTFHDECELYVRRLRCGRPATTAHCLVQFTSGSTGLPKAVGRTPRSLLDELGAFRKMAMPGSDARVLLLGPISHPFTLVGGLLRHMDVGAVSIFPQAASRLEVLRCAARSGADTLMGGPADFAALTSMERWVRLPHLHDAISSGDRLSAGTHTRFAERYGVRIRQAYGTTESGVVAADPDGWFAPDAVGRAAPGVRLRIVAGELQLRMAATPYVAAHGAPVSSYVPDGTPDGPGWFKTGDRAELDTESGALRVLERIDPLRDRHNATSGADHLVLSDRTASRPLSPTAHR